LADAARGEAIRVLHVDDEEDQLEFVKLFLADIDPAISVDSAVRTEDALRKLGESPYDCILCDYQMPEMNGVDLAKLIRAEKKTPIIIYTGRGSEEVAEAAFAAEVDDYIRKEATPSHYHVLAKSIRQIVEKRRVEELYRTIIEQGSYPFVISDGVAVIYANKAVADMLGVTDPKELMGKGFAEWFPEEERDRIVAEAAKMAPFIGLPAIYKASLRRRDGAVIKIEAAVSIINFAGKPLALIFVRDITEKTHTEEALLRAYENGERLLASERATRAKFAALNRSAVELGRVKSVESVYAIAIKTVDETLGFGWCGVGEVDDGVIRYRQYRGTSIPDDFSIPLDKRSIMTRTARTGATQLVSDVRLDADYLTPRPDEVNLSELAVPIKIDGVVHAVLNIESKEANAFTRDDVALVETLAAHVSTALERLGEVQRLERSVAEKTRELLEGSQMVAAGKVAATVAHDIKGPLQLIKNMVYLARQRPERMVEFLDKIVGAVDHANNMIEGVKQATKEAPLVLASTDLSRVVTEGASVAEGAAEVKLRLEVEPLGLQIVDASKMRRVVENLTRNAIDAMPSGGFVTVSAKLDGSAVVIKVSDTGVGIAPEYIPRLFKAFESTKSQGMGLGLAFCKQTVEAHGGTIEVESTPGVGTTFIIRLPSRPTPG